MQYELNEANERVVVLSAAEKKRLRGVFPLFQAAAFHLGRDDYSRAALAIESLLAESAAPGVSAAETTKEPADDE